MRTTTRSWPALSGAIGRQLAAGDSHHNSNNPDQHSAEQSGDTFLKTMLTTTPTILASNQESHQETRCPYRMRTSIHTILASTQRSHWETAFYTECVLQLDPGHTSTLSWGDSLLYGMCTTTQTILASRRQHSICNAYSNSHNPGQHSVEPSGDSFLQGIRTTTHAILTSTR